GGCGLSGNETDDGLRHLRAHVLRRLLFVGPADLADHDDRARFRVRLERRQAVDEGRAVDGIATDPNARALADPGLRELVDDLVRERTGAGNDADRTGCRDLAGQDADLRLAGRECARAVRSDQ